jgi:hypothetical protein
MPKAKPQRPRALASSCGGCGQPVIKGVADVGPVVVTDAPYLDAAQELEAWAAGTPTFALTWAGHLTITARTAHDMTINPAGPHTPVVRTHHCPAHQGAHP